MTDLRSAAIALYDRFTHEGMDRRAVMAEMTRIAGSAAAASALVSAIAASPAAAAVVAEEDRRIRARAMSWPVGRTYMMKGYAAEPAVPAGALGSVLVVHENRGLNAHTRDVARRLAVAGYRAVAADFLSPSGGTPADEDAARDAIGKLDLAATTADAAATLRMLAMLPGSNGKVGIVGFCWGGATVIRVAVAAGKALNAGVSFYGPAPAPAEAARVEAAMLVILAGKDERVNATGLPWIEALKAAGKGEGIVYPDVEHAFHNDTSAARYNEEAAKAAWQATLAHFRTHLE
jgi:carboxymethylenebutenolidase